MPAITVPILVLDIKLVIGPAEPGNMKLLEMFPAQEDPDENAEIDWIDDLKFYIDDDHHMLSHYIFPAVRKHEKRLKDKDAYKLYLEPVMSCCKHYCEKFNIKEPEKKFNKEGIVRLAKQIAEEQKKHIEDGDYEKQ